MRYFEEESTTFVQSCGSKEGAISPAIVSSASFAYGSPESAEKIFDGSIKKPMYSRMGNPTSAKLESLLSDMDGGVGAIATSSGMGAITLCVMSLLSCGDEVISVGGLFGGTYAFFTQSATRFGVKTSFFDVDDLKQIESAITDHTKIIFLESIGNPNMRLPDIRAIAAIASKYGVLLVVDNTLTPLSVKPLELGADIVIYSTTKIINGHSSALGGAVVYRAVQSSGDKLSSSRYPFAQKFIDNLGQGAFIGIGKKRALRDFGMSASAHNSYQTIIGLQTLPLRQDRVTSSVERVALELDRAGLKVNHPVLKSHPHHSRYKEQFKRGCGALMSLDFDSQERAFRFLNSSNLATITANLGDSRTLALHMASTIYADFDEKQREFLGISDGLVRICIGLERADDIIEDFIDAARSI